MLLCACFLTACGDKPKDDEIGYYKKVGSYAEPTQGTYVATDRDLTQGGGGGVNVDNPDATPTPEPAVKYVVVLDPGHGGRQLGAVYDGRNEKDCNLKLAVMLKEYLETHYDNVTVYLTRSTDTVLSDDLGEDLRMRVEYAVEKHADILVSLHLNASEGHDLRGCMACISKQPNVTEQSRALTKSILERLSSLGLKNRGPYLRDSEEMKDADGKPLDYYAICRHGAANNLVAIILESCFMDNPTDIEFIRTDEKMALMAEQEALGIMDYLTSR